MACPFPSSDPNVKLTAEEASEAATVMVARGQCVVVAESFAALLPLLPQAVAPSFWYSVRIW